MSKMADVIRGYKAFETSDDGGLHCRDMAYEVGKSYALDGKPELCKRGYHFCRLLRDCYNFYASDSRICEVEAWGTVIDGGSGKSVTDHIHIVRELDRHEVLDAANSGNGCTGILNAGDRNSGDFNAGDRNAGNRNSGDFNAGDRNSGDFNAGDRNSGDFNAGNRNSGDFNAGNRNSGCYNSGYFNAGNRNSGCYNSGDFNAGDWNSGDWNITNCSSGVLCTQEQECLIFDAPSGMTLTEWRVSEAADLMRRIDMDYDRWICASDMSSDEKSKHPEYKNTGGYLRKGTGKHDFAGWWDRLTSKERSVILDIPNFDAEKWKLITGIEVS
jgi:hypothetical protein